MAAANRAALLTKLQKVLKKHFKPTLPDTSRPLIQQLLLAACLENSPPEAAERVYKTLLEKFFDLNEMRVSTVRELAEMMKELGDPEEAAGRLKGILQSVFDSLYSFDLESLKKQNIGQAVKKIESMRGATPFVVAYATQSALGGHAIPINKGALVAMAAVGLISDQDAEHYRTPGLERAVPKNKGAEFGSLLQQLGAVVHASPYSPNTRKLLLEINPDCKDRLPKRAVKPPEPPPAPPKPEPAAPAKGKDAKSAPEPAKPKAPDKKAAGKPEAKPTAKAEPKVEAKADAKKKPEKHTPADAKRPKPKGNVAKGVEGKKKPPPSKPAAKPPIKAKTSSGKKTPAQRLSKQKPR